MEDTTGVAVGFMARTGKVVHIYSACVLRPRKFLPIWLTEAEVAEKERLGIRACPACLMWRQTHS